MFRLECVTRAGLLPAIADPPTTPQSDKTPSRAGLLPAYADPPTDAKELKSASRAGLLPAYAASPSHPLRLSLMPVLQWVR